VLDRIFRGALGVALLVAVAAGCSEQVTGTLGCPDLCADESQVLRDTVLLGSVVTDTTLMGFPLLGTTPSITLVARGDTADVRLAIRYDTLPNMFVPAGGTLDTIRVVDSAHVLFLTDSTQPKPTVPITLEAYDVDTTADNTGAVIPLFRADHLLGSKTYAVGEVTDTMKLPLNNAAVLSKIQANKPLRIGMRISGPTSVQLLIAGTLMVPIVRFRPSLDTLVPFDTVVVRSKTPADDQATAASLALYPVYVSGVLPTPPPSLLAVGGIGGARSYIKFNLPDIVLDSVKVVRATIQLQQLPSRSVGGAADSITLSALAILAAPAFTDLYTLSSFLVPSGSPSLTLHPGDSGLQELEVGRLVQEWKSRGAANVNQSVFLRATQEGASPGELNFVSNSTANPSALRPRLRIIYVPRRGFGLP
jgi:hypothetical protein